MHMVTLVSLKNGTLNTVSVLGKNCISLSLQQPAVLVKQQIINKDSNVTSLHYFVLITIHLLLFKRMAMGLQFSY